MKQPSFISVGSSLSFCESRFVDLSDPGSLSPRFWAAFFNRSISFGHFDSSCSFPHIAHLGCCCIAGFANDWAAPFLSAELAPLPFPLLAGEDDSVPI